MKITINNKEIELTPEQVKTLREELGKEKKGLWKPCDGETYYFISYRGAIGEDSFKILDDCDSDIVSIGNCYNTEEEAKAHVEKLRAIQRVKEYIAENCEPFTPNWGNVDQNKYIVYFDNHERVFDFSSFVNHDHCAPIPHLSTEKDVLKVIKNCKKDLKIIWGIK